jgi:hypothetical protein
VSWLVLLLIGAAQVVPPETRLAVGCVVTGDRDARIYELRRDRNDQWLLMMHSRKAGKSPVLLPLPDAQPEISTNRMTLSYETLNGGRHIEWSVAPSGASLDVHVNFELEVNIEADLDPRVELMNTDGPLTNLACEVAPAK